MKMRLTALAALVIALSPTIAFARPTQSAVAHLRPTLFHDRSIHIHERGSVAHH